MITRPGIARSGYVGTIDDLAHKATTVMWYGPRTALLTAIIREGARRGISVSVQARKYSLQQISAAAEAISKQAAEGKWAGFKISGIAGVSAVDNGITVDGTYTAIPAAKRAPQVRSLATMVMGVPVHLAPGHPIALAGARYSDSAPFNSGGFMVTYYSHGNPPGHGYCTSGFAIWMNGRSYTTTAAHCAYSDFVDAADGILPSPPSVSYWYGNQITTSTQGGALVLGNNGFYWMFNHGWNSTTHSTVIGYEDLGVNDLVCTEGGNSGEHCAVKVTNLSVWVNGVQDIEATQVNGTIAVINGDSGGPVMSLKNTSSGQVRAAGMIQAGTSNLSSCGATYIQGPDSPGPCGSTVYFSSMRTIVCHIQSGVALYSSVGNLGCSYSG